MWIFLRLGGPGCHTAGRSGVRAGSALAAGDLTNGGAAFLAGALRAAGLFALAATGVTAGVATVVVAGVVTAGFGATGLAAGLTPSPVSACTGLTTRSCTVSTTVPVSSSAFVTILTT